jgi:hypothetical protein
MMDKGWLPMRIAWHGGAQSSAAENQADRFLHLVHFTDTSFTKIFRCPQKRVNFTVMDSLGRDVRFITLTHCPEQPDVADFG